MKEETLNFIFPSLFEVDQAGLRVDSTKDNDLTVVRVFPGRPEKEVRQFERYHTQSWRKLAGWQVLIKDVPDWRYYFKILGLVDTRRLFLYDKAVGDCVRPIGSVGRYVPQSIKKNVTGEVWDDNVVVEYLKDYSYHDLLSRTHQIGMYFLEAQFVNGRIADLTCTVKQDIH